LDQHSGICELGSHVSSTPEEAQSIVASSIAYYGTYSIDENTKAMLVNLAASTHANVAAIPNPEENNYSADLRRAKIRQLPNAKRYDASNFMEARSRALEDFS
jgi:hypothetical protein